MQYPSVPIYTAQVVAVPLYVLQAVNAETQVLPFVLQLSWYYLQSSSVLNAPFSHFLALHLEPPASPSHTPSDPIYPTQVVLSPEYVEHKGFVVAKTQPFPVVIHPFWYALQSSSVAKDNGAFAHSLALQFVVPAANSQFPSDPIND